MMKSINIFMILLMAGNISSAQIVKSALILKANDHPRILLLKGEEYAIKQTIATDEIWKKLDQFIITESDKIIEKSPVERVLIGRRLLDKSREALSRIFYLSYAYRMTADSKYLDRAEKEMLAVSSFSDWNPSHFLDV
ncbi:MAG: heparinase, partial [Bacteroidia bacterium]|nr:heparinase [Bacteroidia bacterium]